MIQYHMQLAHESLPKHMLQQGHHAVSLKVRAHVRAKWTSCERDFQRPGATRQTCNYRPLTSSLEGLLPSQRDSDQVSKRQAYHCHEWVGVCVVFPWLDKYVQRELESLAIFFMF